MKNILPALLASVLCSLAVLVGVTEIAVYKA